MSGTRRRIASWNEVLREALADPDLLRRERAASLEKGLVYMDAGKVRVIELKLRPRVLSSAQRRYLERVAAAVARVQAQVARHWLGDVALQRALPLDGRERGLLTAVAGRAAFAAPVVSRLDASVPLAELRWREALRLFELNSVGIGGLFLVPVAETVVEEVILPALSPGLALRRGPDTRASLARTLARHARRLGARRPVVGLVEDRAAQGGTREFDELARCFEAWGLKAELGDLSELAWRGGGLRLGGRRVDLVYRDVEVQELVRMRGAPKLQEALREGLAAGRVVSGIAGDFDHKSLWEVLTEPSLARWVPARDRALLRRHALWTRLVYPRRTLDERGRPVELEKALARGRERFVLKPNRSYGGDGVTVGVDVSQARWERVLERAFRRPGTWVAQALGEVAVEAFPVPGRGGVKLVDHYVDCGIYRVGGAFGVLSRASRRRVVNVSSGGGLAAVLQGA